MTVQPRPDDVNAEQPPTLPDPVPTDRVVALIRQVAGIAVAALIIPIRNFPRLMFRLVTATSTMSPFAVAQTFPRSASRRTKAAVPRPASSAACRVFRKSEDARAAADSQFSPSPSVRAITSPSSIPTSIAPSTPG